MFLYYAARCETPEANALMDFSLFLCSCTEHFDFDKAARLAMDSSAQGILWRVMRTTRLLNMATLPAGEEVLSRIAVGPE